MTKDDLQKVRDALSAMTDASLHHPTRWKGVDAIEILDAALAAPEPQPFGYVRSNAAAEILFNGHCETAIFREQGSHTIVLYTAPVAAPQREWVGLTVEERRELLTRHRDTAYLAIKVEAALKEKNHG